MILDLTRSEVMMLARMLEEWLNRNPRPMRSQPRLDLAERLIHLLDYGPMERTGPLTAEDFESLAVLEQRRDHHQAEAERLLALGTQLADRDGPRAAAHASLALYYHALLP